MKKKILVLLIGAFVFSVSAQDKMKVIKFEPVSVAIGCPNLSLECALSKKTSLQINTSLISLKINDTKYSGVDLGVDYKIYWSPAKKAPNGMYFSPGLNFISISDKNNLNNGTELIYSIKGVVGHQWIWNSGFSLDINGGISYTINSDIINFENSFKKNSVITPALGASIGYAW